MTTEMSGVTWRLVSSLDGFTAKKHVSVSCLHATDSQDNSIVLTDDDIQKFVKGVDCYIMGSET